MHEDELPKSLIIPEITVKIPMPEGAAVPPLYYPAQEPARDAQPETS